MDVRINEESPLAWSDSDRHFMELALAEARAAFDLGEVPVGAVIVQRPAAGEAVVVATAHNLRQMARDPTAHAEILCLREAGRKVDSWQLTECDLYVTLEPCPMCAGAMVNSRLRRVVFGCTDPKAGAAVTLYQILSDARLNHRPEVAGGLYAAECGELLRNFFSARRADARRE